MKVAIIDSGKGGKYIGSLVKSLFNYEVVQWVPTYFSSYSDMTMDDLIEICNSHIQFIQMQNVDLVIIGCMTLSTNLKRYIKRRINWGIPVHDLYEYLPKFDKQTLVIGTTNTIKSGAFNEYITLATPALSKIIENDYLDIIPSKLKSYELTFKMPRFNRVILGCSHYSIYKNIFKSYYLNKEIIDPVEYLLESIELLYEL